MDSREMFERAASVASELARSARPEQMGLPTPCTEWDVAALLEHMAGGPAYMAGAVGADETAVQGWPDAAAVAAVSAGWPSPVRSTVGACRRPGSSGRWRRPPRARRWIS